MKKKIDFNLFKKIISNSNTNILLSGSAIAFFFRVTSLCIAFFINVIFAQNLSKVDFGYYAVLMAVIGILSVPTKVGLDVTAVKFFSKYSSFAENEKMKGFIYFSFPVILIVSILVGGIAVSLKWAGLYFEDFNYNLLLWSMLCLPLINLVKMFQSIFRGLKEILISVSSESLSGGLLLLLVFLYTKKYIHLGSISPTIVFKTMFLVSMTSLLAFTVLFFIRYKFVFKYKPVFEVSNWIKVGFPLLMISSMHIILKQMDVVMIGELESTDESGVYSISSRLSELGYIGIGAINTIGAPMMASLFAEKNGKDLKRVYRYSTLGSGAVSFAMLIGMLFFAPFLIQLHGDEYSDAYYPLIILMVAKTLVSFSGASDLLMSMTGLQNLQATLMGIAALLNLGLNYLLIPHWGGVGAAVATGISLLVWRTLSAFYAYKKLGISPI